MNLWREGLRLSILFVKILSGMHALTTISKESLFRFIEQLLHLANITDQKHQLFNESKK